MAVSVRLRRLRDEDRDVEPPRYMSAGAAGMDLRAANREPIVIEPGQRTLVPTGFAIEIPPGYEGQVRPRSGLALKQGVTVANAPGTIDFDFRGEMSVILVNLSDSPHTISRNDRIAQLVIAPVTRAEVELVDALSETARGANGFGSSGLK